MPHPFQIFSQSDDLIQIVDIYWMANNADPDQLASEAYWSGSTLFAKAGRIRIQQD